VQVVPRAPATSDLRVFVVLLSQLDDHAEDAEDLCAHFVAETTQPSRAAATN